MNKKKINSIKIIIPLFLIICAAVVAFFVWKGADRADGGEVKVYDVAVMRKDQVQSDPDEDRRSSLKAGDVALAREVGRDWSDTEKRIFLIIKMNLDETQAARLVEPETVKLSEKEAKAKGRFDEEMLKEISKEEKKEMLNETFRARRYRIGIEQAGFDLEKVDENPPGTVYGWEIVEDKAGFKLFSR
jgi:hypothetical protein